MKKKSLVIEYDGRYFRCWKNNRLCSAWSLAGAKHFMPSDIFRLHKILDSIKRRKKKNIKILVCEITNEIMNSKNEMSQTSFSSPA